MVSLLTYLLTYTAAAVRFLTRTFRNVFYVRVGKRYVRLLCGVRSARERSFEEACGETDVGRSLPPARKPNPNLKQRPPRSLFLPETGQFLLLCSLQLWQQLQLCRQTRARVQVINAFYFRSTATVRRERHVS